MFGLNLVHRKDSARRARLQFDGRLPAQLWGHEINDDGIMCIQGTPVTELAKSYGTPIHIVDVQQLEACFSRFRDAFLAHYPHVDVGISYKTNPVPGVLMALHNAGALAEVISHFELWLALRLGVPPEQIVFNGPGKTATALQLALSRGIKLINIDGFDELEQLGSLAKAARCKQRVGVRIVTSVGWGGQFGLRVSDGSAYSALERLAKTEYLEPCAIHMHLGTGIQNVEAYLAAIDEMLSLVEHAQSKLGIQFEILDIGGGFGVGTVHEYSTLDERLLLSGFPAQLHDPGLCPEIGIYGEKVGRLVRARLEGQAVLPTLMLEPGRAVMSSAQCLLLSVLNIKDRERAVRTVITDGGKNLTMPLGYEFHEILPASRMHAELAGYRTNLFGPLCHPADTLARQLRLPELEIGDLLSVMDTGAYFIPNQMNFSTPRAAVACIDHGSHRLLRQRESFDDIISNDVLD